MIKTNNTITSANEEKQNLGNNEINSASFISNDASFARDLKDQSPIPDFQFANKKLSRKITSTIGTKT